MIQHRKPNARSSLKQNHLWMIVFSLIIAGSFPVSASITKHIDSTVLAFWRFLGATLLFGLMLPFAKGPRLPGWRDLGRYGLVGGSYGVFFILMFEALKFTSPLNTSTIYTMLPLLTGLTGRALGEPLPVRQMSVLALSMVAALWVIFHGDWDRFSRMQYNRGDMLFFLGTCCLAVYMHALKRLQRKESNISFTFFSLLTATLALFIVAMLRAEGLPFPGPPIWLGIAYLAGPSTAVTFWILQHTAPRLGPSRVVAYTFLTPSAVVAIEWVFGLSSPEWRLLPGIGLTLAAVCLLQMDFVTQSR